MKGKRETWPLKSRGARDHLSYQCHLECGRVPGSQALQDALGVLHSKARHECPQAATYVRVAFLGDRIYYDLADPDRNVIEIRAGQWSYVSDPPVYFRRPRGISAMPKPEAGGALDELKLFVNITSTPSWHLTLVWLVALFFDGPYTWLVLQGRPGAAKTYSSRTLRQLVDPNKSPVRAPPRTVKDLVIAAANSAAVVLDNLSYINEEMSDAICRLATGGGISMRELYSDLDEVIVEVMRAGILTGVTDVVVRGDLFERCILIELQPLGKGKRKTEKALNRAFAEAWPRLLGTVLDVVAAVMEVMPTVELEDAPRMADFATVGVALERVLGWAPGTFLADYAQAAGAANDVILDGSVIAPWLKKIAENGGFDGTATEVLDRLDDWFDGRIPRGPFGQVSPRQRQRPDGWPKSPRALSSQLRRLAPTLLAVGVMVTFEKTHGAGSRKTISIRLASPSGEVVLDQNTAVQSDPAGASQASVASAPTPNPPPEPRIASAANRTRCRHRGGHRPRSPPDARA